MDRGVKVAAALLATGALAGCGASKLQPATAGRTSTVASATASPVPTPAATTTPLPSPPPPPLMIVWQSGIIEAIDGQGTIHWSFKASTVVDGGEPLVGGSHLLMIAGTAVTVIDRGGIVVGHGSAVPSQALNGSPQLNPDPTGTRWAWSTVDSAPNAGQWSGAVWVAGIGEAPHRLENWTEPADTEVDVFLWSDRGIVTAVVPSACAPTPQETSTALLDPATGRSTPLEGGDRHVVDVHAGLVLAMRQPETLLVTGVHSTTLTEAPATQGEHLQLAAISPDGAHVFGSMQAMTGCGGPPEVRTVVLDPATNHTTVVPNLFAEAWYDDTHLVVHRVDDEALRLVDLDGNGGGAVLTHGRLIGVIR